jgi:hypothetical protein
MKSRRITALFTLLAMLVAPLCAPFCGSHVCANSSSAQDENCHGTSALNDNTPQVSLAVAHTCGLQELPTAALSETTNSLDFVKQTYATYTSLHFVAPPSLLLAASGTHSPHPQLESRIESGSLRLSILRI